ncbi:MAG: hypothetical protein ABIP79_14110 [Chitinophagaceae bacterium]
MEYLGKHSDREVYWWNFSVKNFDELPKGDWVGFSIEEKLPEYDLFEKFARASIAKGILEFKAFGKESTKLDDWFDDVIVLLNVMDNQPDAFVMTTWNDKESLADAFWQCFHATALPDEVVNENVKIVCFHINDIDKRDELKNYLKLFNEGWLPSDEE